MAIKIYTDGSCLQNPGGNGGAAWSIHYEDGVIVYGGEHLGASTNNRAELTAIIRGLQAIPDESHVELYSDSRYSLNQINGYDGKTRKFVKANKAKANKDLIKQLTEQAERCSIIFKHWVKGHNGHVENEKVDKLARVAADTPNYTHIDLVTPNNNIIKNAYDRSAIVHFLTVHIAKLDDKGLAKFAREALTIDMDFDTIMKTFKTSAKLDIK